MQHFDHSALEHRYALAVSDRRLVRRNQPLGIGNRRFVGRKGSIGSGDLGGMDQRLAVISHCGALLAGERMSSCIADIGRHPVKRDPPPGPRRQQDFLDRIAQLMPVRARLCPQILCQISKPRYHTRHSVNRDDMLSGQHGARAFDHRPDRQARRHPHRVCRLLHGVDFWHLHRIGLRCHNRSKIIQHPRRPKAIDPHDQLPVSPATGQNRRHRGIPCIGLGIGRNRVFQIKDHTIAIQTARLFNRPGV